MKKIWGIRSGLIGDTLIAKSGIKYLKKKYPDSYITWVIQKKCSQAAPLYINQEGIDKIYISGWEDLSKEDIVERDKHDIILNVSPPVRDQYWFNKMSCLDQVFRMAEFDDYKDIMTEEELEPNLIKWWIDPSSQNNLKNHAYSTFESPSEKRGGNIAIWPFAHYHDVLNRSPSSNWWEALYYKLKGKYEFHQFGWISEPSIFDHRHNEKSFFEQIKLSLECDIIVGTDSGSMWILGAYKKPSIYLMTYHMYGHNENPESLRPINKNGKMFFHPINCDAIQHKFVIDELEKFFEGLRR
jgi:ADP-heptose:LPS heptosyltransferase